MFDKGHFRGSLLSQEGVRQGDCLGTLLFSLSMQRIYQEYIANIAGVKGVAIADDFNIFGPPQAVFKAFENLSRLSLNTGLRIRFDKCGLLWPRMSEVPEVVRTWATRRRVPLALGCMETLGAPVGADCKEVGEILSRKVESHQNFFENILHPKLPVQVALLLLRKSAIPAMGYLTRVVPPSRLAPHAAAFDARVLRTVVTKLDLPSPLPDVARDTLLLPIRLGGFGMRPVLTTSPTAYWSSLAAVAQNLSGLIPPQDRSRFLLEPETQVSFARELSTCHTHR